MSGALALPNGAEKLISEDKRYFSENLDALGVPCPCYDVRNIVDDLYPLGMVVDAVPDDAVAPESKKLSPHSSNSAILYMYHSTSMNST
jgi:hypothetical protein